MASQRVLIENLHLAFGNNEVLKGIDLEIRPGEFFAFLGPSGSGKSTLLRAIAGFGPPPSRGRILIGDEDVSGLPPWERNVGMVFQNYALWPHMTVWKNVAFGLEERHMPKTEIASRVEEALAMVGLLDLAHRRPSQLSGGQQQRVALARTLVVRPRVLLLDEPLSNLDANLRVQMRRELKRLQRELGITTIFVTHDQEEANTTADRMAVLDEGVIQQVGTPMELYDEPANLFVASFLGTANRLEGRITTEGGRRIFRGPGDVVLPVADSESEGPAWAIFRPHHVYLYAEDHAQAARPASESAGRFHGHIQRAEFLGSVIRYELALREGGEIYVDMPHHIKDQPLPPGSHVECFVKPEYVRILRN